MENTRYLLVGGGVACVTAAQAIRERDKDGRVLIVGQEAHPPYDRPPLSKQALVKDDFKVDDPYSKFDNFYPDNAIDLITGVRVTGIDLDARTATLADGRQIGFEKLLIATGSTPKPLPVEGAALPGVRYLRTIEDSFGIAEALRSAKRVIVIGAGYMGVEVASGCLVRGLATEIIEPSGHPWAKFASPRLGDFMRRRYEKAGAVFHFGHEATGFEAVDEGIAVRTNGGERLSGDLVIACVGVGLNLDLAKSAGLAVDDKNGVVVDDHLRASAPDVWAAGDIAYFKDRALDKRWHAEHFLNAKWQGKAAGTNMAGEAKPYDEVAYFFSDFLDLHMILRGDPQAGRSARVLGDMEAGEFVELYATPEGTLTMGIAMSHEEKGLDPISDRLEALVRDRASVNDLDPGSVGLSTG